MVADPAIMSNYNKIPAKLKGYNQWICWRFVILEVGKKPTKVPYNPKTGFQASVQNPAHWTSFDVALSYVGKFDGIGFVLTENDPFVFIDLDDPGEDAQLRRMHSQIVQAFQTYSERSPSGTGTHIICEGSIEEGKRSSANAAEMYFSGRYMTMTGDVVCDMNITEQQDYVDMLYRDIDKNRSKPKLVVDNTSGRFESCPQSRSDEDVIAACLNAQNGELFRALYAGGWEKISRYQHSNSEPNQSAADQAIFNFLGFHSKNAEQIARIFHQSVLGKRKKAFRKDYLQTMLDNSADQSLPIPERIKGLDMDWQKIAAGSQQANEPASQPAAELTATQGEDAPQAPHSATSGFTPPSTSPDWVLNPPPGLIRDAATFLYDAAYLQVREIALAGAIGLLAGIAGRSFNVGGSGLNLYINLLAATGSGKEAISSGLGAIEDSLAMSNPLVSGRILGPSNFASEQGLMRYLGENPCFVSIIGEFDEFVDKVCGPRSSENGAGLKKALLDTYNKNGVGNSYRGSRYSDRQKNIEAVKQPSLSIIGECTIEGMKDTVNEKMIASGFIPRLITIVYKGKRNYPNRNRLTINNEQTGLIQRLLILFNGCLQITAHNRPVNVEFEPEALRYAHSMEIWITDKMNGMQEHSAIHQLYNRAAQNILKLAALACVEVNGAHINMQAKIGLHHIMWASSVVFSSIEFWLKSFTKHEIGEQNNDIAQLRDVKRNLMKYYQLDIHQRRTYRITDKLWSEQIVTYAFIQSRTATHKSLKEDKQGYTRALDKVIKILEDIGAIFDIRKDPDCKNKYGTAQRAYKIIDKNLMAD